MDRFAHTSNIFFDILVCLSDQDSSFLHLNKRTLRLYIAPTVVLLTRLLVYNLLMLFDIDIPRKVSVRLSTTMHSSRLEKTCGLATLILMRICNNFVCSHIQAKRTRHCTPFVCTCAWKKICRKKIESIYCNVCMRYSINTTSLSKTITTSYLPKVLLKMRKQVYNLLSGD